MMKQFASFFFSYKGRVGRKGYLLSHLCGLGGYVLLTYFYITGVAYRDLDSLLAVGQFLLVEIGQFLLVVMGLLLLYCTIPISIKRYHDLNRSCWSFWLWSWLIPLVVLIGMILSLMFHDDGHEFEFRRTLAFALYTVIECIYLLGSFIVLCCLSGTAGENRYGDPPSSHRHRL